MATGFVEDVYGRVEQIIGSSKGATPRAVVVTPSVGSSFLAKAIEGVLSQSYHDIMHLVVVDGPDFEHDVAAITSKFDDERCRPLVLPFNTGRNGINGHRIYASVPLLLNSDYVFFLDEDNWWELDHARSLIELLESKGLGWAHSMRKICSHEGQHIADDNCESIGPYAPFSSVIKGWPSYIDTNCYAFRRTTIAQMAHHWYHPLRADRYFFHQLIRHCPHYLSSGQYTVNYRLKQNGPVSEEYILQGNEYMLDKYQACLPWL